MTKKKKIVEPAAAAAPSNVSATVPAASVEIVVDETRELITLGRVEELEKRMVVAMDTLKFLAAELKNVIDAQSRHTVSSSNWREQIFRRFKAKETEMGWTDMPKL